jgi:hypothetical protein
MWSARLLAIVVAAVVAACWVGVARAERAPVPRYDHVFVLIDENHGFGQIIGNPAAPEINALAQTYGLATRYSGTSDPSEPNYVAMLGGSDFGITNDDPYFFPANTVHAPNLLVQLERAGLSWKGYFQGMPYAGYRGYCFPAKCNGIPDSDTQYVAKHNGIVNFADMQNPSEFAKLTPFRQLALDLASGEVANLSYIVPDECRDMHGAPPWCVDSGAPGDVDDNWLVSTGDAFVGQAVEEITSSSLWETGRNAIVVTFDEGAGPAPGGHVATVVIANHGPRGLRDATTYNHYSLLATLEQAFGVGCLLQSCAATPMSPLFQAAGPLNVPDLPAAATVATSGADDVSVGGTPVAGPAVAGTCAPGWRVVPSPSIGRLDNNLAAISAASPSDAWAVGDYLDRANPNVLVDLGEHWDGHRWTAYPLPNVGANENTLFAVADLPHGQAWAVGYFVNREHLQRALVEHWDGAAWQVVPSPDPGQTGDILYGVVALAADDIWAVGGQEDASEVWHPLAEHWDGGQWTVAATPDPNGGGNLLYAITATSPTAVYAVGQQGDAFPSSTLLERWNGSTWSTLDAPSDTDASLDPFGISTDGTTLTIVGARESDTTPFATLVTSGTPDHLAFATTPNKGTSENDLFGSAPGANGSTWAVGWDIDPRNGNHEALVEHAVAGHWTVTTSPEPGTGDNGLAAITPIPGGGLWAAGITTNADGNPAPLIERHC